MAQTTVTVAVTVLSKFTCHTLNELSPEGKLDVSGTVLPELTPPLIAILPVGHGTLTPCPVKVYVTYLMFDVLNPPAGPT